MTDVNLLQDTNFDDERSEKEKKLRGVKRSVPFTDPAEKKAPDPTKSGDLLPDAHSGSGSAGKEREVKLGVVLSDSLQRQAPDPPGNGKSPRSLLDRISSIFRFQGGHKKPARILHAQYHDGSPAPHVAPPPPPDGKRTGVLAPGPVSSKAPFVPPARPERGLTPPPVSSAAMPVPPRVADRASQKPAAGIPPPPPPAATKPVAQAVGKKGAGEMTTGDREVGGPTMPGVNLVPEELQNAAGSKNKLVMVGLTAAVTLLLIGVASVGMLLVKQMLTKQANAIKQDIEQMDGQRRRLTAQKRDAIKLHAETLQAMDLLNAHIYWTQFFKQLEEVTVDTVAYRSVTADQAGRVTVLATGTDFRSVARQLIAYQEDAEFIKDVSITSASASLAAGAATVDFTATLTLQPGAFFLPPSSSAAATVPPTPSTP